MKSSRFFAKKTVRLPQYPHVIMIYCFPDEVIFINLSARPGANVIWLDPPKRGAAALRR